jgi:hypothetical protein
MNPYTSAVTPAGQPGRLADEQRRDRDHGQADRHVDEQHPPPGQPLGDHPAEHQAQRGPAGDDAHVDAERPGPLPPLGEAGHDQGEDGGRGEGPAHALQGPRGQQQAAGGGEPSGQRGQGEQADAGQEDPPPAEDVAGPAPEQQQAA